MDRKQIVINGCSGGCCEAFTLPVSFEDIENMMKQYEISDENKEQSKVICYNGIERWPISQGEGQKLIEMLIPLGEYTIDPQTGKSFTEIQQDVLKYYLDKGLEGEELKKAFINHNHHGFNNLIIKEDGGLQVTQQVFTCKHLDKEKKICTNYENRPNLCKSFGTDCRYSGCHYAAICNSPQAMYNYLELDKKEEAVN